MIHTGELGDWVERVENVIAVDAPQDGAGNSSLTASSSNRISESFLGVVVGGRGQQLGDGIGDPFGMASAS